MRAILKAKFNVSGNLRFISHQEMLRVWHRGLIRSGVAVCFSEGFNPHPRISLPLPRSVGLEAEDEVACVWIEYPENAPLDISEAKARISKQLPAGCLLTDMEMPAGKISFQAVGVMYFLPVPVSEEIRTAAGNLLSRLAASEQITVERRVDETARRRVVEVNEYISSISIDDKGVSVECRIKPAGSIRVDEIMSLLHIDVSLLTGPVRRTSVRWLEKN